MDKDLPMKYKELEEGPGKIWAERLHKDCLPYIEGFAKFGDENVFMVKRFADFRQDIKDFCVRDSDVFVLTYPRSGTTWTQEMIWTLFYGIDTKGESLKSRSPALEGSLHRPKEMTSNKTSFDVLNEMPQNTPRVIKSHMPFSILPTQLCESIKSNKNGAKVIYVLRDPRDVCLSLYHVNQATGYNGPIKEFVEAFVTDNFLYMPYRNHIDAFWKLKDNRNVCFLKYEDMKKDLKSVLENVIQFLNLPQKSEEEMEKILNHLSFESMSANPGVNREEQEHIREALWGEVGKGAKFLRKGKVGAWKEELDDELIQMLEKWKIDNHIHWY